MTLLFSAAPAYKNAFYQLAPSAINDASVLVSFGHPGLNQQNDMIGFMAVRAEQVEANLTNRRSREETLELTVLVSVYRGGGPEMEQVCSDRAYSLLGSLENYVRYTNTTLNISGVDTVRECALTSHTSDGATRPEFLSQGRLIEIEAVFTAKARLTN